ncbi:hypothetical protein [Bifidobacterium sp.]|uniref:hypothetical protein n=1 Tax=Bifidobacterium sp. TaxID=41200 RepID=UPI0025C659ED|nr:hypothetical protein [Bifidobacterium sp.]MCI1635183.1 hypothetical protein [Bifidobacterium sp.]
MSNRRETTEMLSALVEKRLRSSGMFWAPEVNFDKGTPRNRRVDFVGFKPFTPNYVVEPASVELGRFEFYEVKSCMADFKSGNGLTFYGDLNYLVTTREFAEELHQKIMLPRGVNGVLVPNKPRTALISAFLGMGEDQSYRKRQSSEMLWQIMTARHHYDIGEGATDE